MPELRRRSSLGSTSDGRKAAPVAKRWDTTIASRPCRRPLHAPARTVRHERTRARCRVARRQQRGRKSTICSACVKGAHPNSKICIYLLTHLYHPTCDAGHCHGRGSAGWRDEKMKSFAAGQRQPNGLANVSGSGGRTSKLRGNHWASGCQRFVRCDWRRHRRPRIWLDAPLR